MRILQSSKDEETKTGNIQNNTTNHFVVVVVVVKQLVKIKSYLLSGHLFVLFLQKEEESSESNFFF